MNGLKPSHKARAPLALAIGASLALGAASVPARAQVFGPVISLSTLDGGNGFRIDGVAAADFSGRAVSAAGDVNGDGIDDLIVGAFGADASGSYSGSSYVVFGRAAGDTFAATLALSGLNGDNGFRIDGVAAGDRSGFAVSAAGDVNGDGIDDLIVGAFGAAPSGSSYVVFGRDEGDTFDATLPLS
ncbi:MAG: FG-GAP repeat protein, partial [Xanthomonadales bacterium]|nr:FG-GAP repeat protein [Xanthomonadales bacterium]